MRCCWTPTQTKNSRDAADSGSPLKCASPIRRLPHPARVFASARAAAAVATVRAGGVRGVRVQPFGTVARLRHCPLGATRRRGQGGAPLATVNGRHRQSRGVRPAVGLTSLNMGQSGTWCDQGQVEAVAELSDFGGGRCQRGACCHTHIHSAKATQAARGPKKRSAFSVLTQGTEQSSRHASFRTRPLRPGNRVRRAAASGVYLEVLGNDIKSFLGQISIAKALDDKGMGVFFRPRAAGSAWGEACWQSSHAPLLPGLLLGGPLLTQLSPGALVRCGHRAHSTVGGPGGCVVNAL